jgi:phosphonopyruvate decarboxylase
MAAREEPFAFVMSRDTVSPHALRTKSPDTPIGERAHHFSESLGRRTSARATRTEALQLIRAARAPGEVLVATTGYTGRELFALGDDPENFYMVGAMGSASAFALGLALHVPDRRVTVIDGDGAALMRLGNFATLGASAPPALTHVVLDNEVHDSTGGQATVSRGVAFAAIAQACGYPRVLSTDEPAALSAALAAPRTGGPLFVHFRIRPGAPEALPRPTLTPAQVFRRLQRWLGEP